MIHETLIPLSYGSRRHLDIGIMDGKYPGLVKELRKISIIKATGIVSRGIEFQFRPNGSYKRLNDLLKQHTEAL